MKKFFLVGCPRSGTTMLQQALNRHSHIAIPAETKLFFAFFGHSRSQQLRHLARLNADLNIQLPPPENRIATLADGRAFYERMAQEYVARLPNKAILSFGEKTPEHTGHLPRIQEMFPEAKFLVLYRDGRDVAASLARMPWMTKNVYAAFTVWLYYHHVVQRMKASRMTNLYFVRYEDLVANPRRELFGILRFLELPEESIVAEGWGGGEGIPLREYAWKQRALEKINDDRVGAFRRELNAEQIAILERIGKYALTSLGYPLITNGEQALPPTFFLKLAYDLSRFAFRLPWRSLLIEMTNRYFCRTWQTVPTLSPALA